MPRARKAPKDWPPVPSSWMRIESSGRPCGCTLVSAPDSMAPTERFTLRATSMNCTFSPLSMAGRDFSISLMSRLFSRPWSWFSTWKRGTSAGTFGCANRRLKSRPRAFQCSMPLLGVEQVGTADQVVELADAQLRHDLAHFLGDEEEVVHHVLGLARELLAQHRVLRGHAHRAGVEVALAHHDAAFDHQRRGGEAELVGAEQRADGDVAAGLHLAVGLHADAAAQAVEHQRLLGFGQADFPGAAGMLDRRPGRGARAAVMAGDHDVVALALGDAGRDRAHADFAHQLDADAGMRRDVLQVVDQLRQILDRIDVVVRRRRDQAHARHRVAQLADVVGDLAARQLAALAGLGALRHLDLELVGRRQVLGRDAEAARGHLLDLRAQRIAVLQRQVDFDVGFADHALERVAHLDRDALELVAVARSDPRRLRRCCSCRRCGSSPRPAWSALRC